MSDPNPATVLSAQVSDPASQPPPSAAVAAAPAGDTSGGSGADQARNHVSNENGNDNNNNNNNNNNASRPHTWLRHRRNPGIHAQSSNNSNNNNNTNGIRQLRLELGRGTSVTLPLQNLRVNGAPTSSSFTTNTNFRVVPPLLPQPAPESTSTSMEDPDEYDWEEGSMEHPDENDWQKYRCSICFEFMNHPVGCGNCNTRFCLQCLTKVLQYHRRSQTNTTTATTSRHNNNNNNNNNQSNAKCPTCRVEFEHPHPDIELYTEMMKRTVTCRFEGCNERLKLPLIAEHEQTKCGHVPMKCRFHSFGCSWVGKRCELQQHEQNDCALQPIKSFVDQFRQLKEYHTNRLEVLQQQTVGSMQMMNVYQRNLQRDQWKSTANLWDILLYCHAMTCTTPHFFVTKEKWVTLFRTEEARAAVVNFLVFLPTLLVCGVTATGGFRDLLRCLGGYELYQYHHPPNPNANTNPNVNTNATDSGMFLEDALFRLCVGMLGILLVVANLVDSKSSQRWRRFRFSPSIVSYIGTPPIVLDLMAVSSLMIHLSVMEYHGAGIKSFFFLWLPMAVATTVFPALIAALSHTAARHMTTTPVPTYKRMITLARSMEPFLFGLRYSALAAFVGGYPCFDAALLIVLLAKPLREKISESLIIRNCFLDQCPKSFGMVYFATKSAQLLYISAGYLDLSTASGETAELEQQPQPQSQQQPESTDTTAYDTISEAFLWIANLLLAIVFLISLNFCFHQLFRFGIALGLSIAVQGHADIRPDGSLEKEYSLLGFLCFAGWICVLGMTTQLG